VIATGSPFECCGHESGQHGTGSWDYREVRERPRSERVPHPEADPDSAYVEKRPQLSPEASS
jgi:hypothetical protein